MTAKEFLIVLVVVLLFIAMTSCKKSDAPLFMSCAQASSENAAPMTQGKGSYNARLDTDHDGVSCEEK